jgi:hypothetical protein
MSAKLREWCAHLRPHQLPNLIIRKPNLPRKLDSVAEHRIFFLPHLALNKLVF